MREKTQQVIDTASRGSVQLGNEDDDVTDGGVMLVKIERGLAVASKPQSQIIAKQDGRMVASCMGRLPTADGDDGENHDGSASNNNTNSNNGDSSHNQRSNRLLQPQQRQRRQILASIGQPPRATRLALGRRGVSLDRSEGRHNDDDLESSSYLPSVGINNGGSRVTPSAATSSSFTTDNNGTASSQFRDDSSRREFIEKLRHFERLTVQTGKGDSAPSSSSSAAAANPSSTPTIQSSSGEKLPLASNSSSNNSSSCQSVPLARRPPPPPPSAPPKPPYQPHPDIENRLRFFDAAFGRHSNNLRERRLENLVATAPPTGNNSNMSASVSSALSQQRLFSDGGGSSNSADDSAIIYSSAHPRPQIPDLMSYSMTAGANNNKSGSGRIDVLNRITNQLLLSTTSASSAASSSQASPAEATSSSINNNNNQPTATPPSQSSLPVANKSNGSGINNSLQATEAELRRELEHLDLMLSNIKENSANTNNNMGDAGNGSDMSPLASIARERRHSVATGAMSNSNGGLRTPRIQTMAITRSGIEAATAPLQKLATEGSKLAPANLRAEIQNYKRANTIDVAELNAPMSPSLSAANDQQSSTSTEVAIATSLSASSSTHQELSSFSPSSHHQITTDDSAELPNNKSADNSLSPESSMNAQQQATPVKPAERSSPPSTVSSAGSHSNSPSPPNGNSSSNNNNNKTRRVVVVRAKVPVSGSPTNLRSTVGTATTMTTTIIAPTSALGENNKKAPQQQATSIQQQTGLETSKAIIVTKDRFHVQESMLSPSSSASSSTGISELTEEPSNNQNKATVVASESLRGPPPPPTPSPPSRDSCSSDASTPPPPPPNSNNNKNSEPSSIIQHHQQQQQQQKSATFSTMPSSYSNSSVNNTSIVMTAVMSNMVMTSLSASRSMTPNGNFVVEVAQPSPSLTPSTTSNSDSNGALTVAAAASGNGSSSNSSTPASNVGAPTFSSVQSPVITSHKQHQQVLRDISTLRHCLIDIETQQQNILQEVSALRAEATAVSEVESIREAIRAAELRFELERERANARLMSARNKVHSAARELQHLEQQQMISTPTNSANDDEGDEEALTDARQQLSTLQEDVADADFELVEAETRYESERERLLARLGAASDAAASASLLAKNGASAGLVGGNSSYDYWIRRLTEHYRQLDGKRQLIERNLSKLQSSLPYNGAAILSSSKDENGLALLGKHFEKDLLSQSTDSDQDKRKHNNDSDANGSNSSNNASDVQSCSDGAAADTSSTTSRPISIGDEQQSNNSTNGGRPSEVSYRSEIIIPASEVNSSSSPAIRLRHHVPTGINARLKAASERPRTLFLPQPDNVTLDLREHLDALTHDWRSCSHVMLSSDGSACRGWLHKLTRRNQPIVRPWSRRWFVFDRQQRHLAYFSDSNEKDSRDHIQFTSILDVYVETSSSSGSGHASSNSSHRNIRPPNSCSNLLIVVSTVDRKLVLAAPSPQAARIWVDVLCTGAAGNQSYETSTPPEDSFKPMATYESSALTLRS